MTSLRFQILTISFFTWIEHLAEPSSLAVPVAVIQDFRGTEALKKTRGFVNEKALANSFNTVLSPTLELSTHDGGMV